ncbi:MAG TPA: ornithine carbamoyltransferase [Candidatus Borkfalkia avistercoris]|uniref:Ornithine carbamoyltransferase n=1 Tax=Candidatus Borkfalkia avistercoris TaxID=2838504 RepID=A0A9D2CYZ6_9FIRM|nr:ornithine carbamoyltransferase [Candidatus Borkfalkia avistercoris]
MDINKYSPKFKLKNSDLLHLADLSSEEIFELLYAAKVMKKKYKVGENVNFLRGKTVGLLFGNVSTRTRVSFELGIRQLGGDYIFLPKDETQLSRGESIKDTAAMLGRFGLSALVLRGFNDAELEDFASYSDIPVVNGISDTSHPLQVLSDLFTVWEKKGRLQNLKLAYIGDGNNVANSLIIGCSKCDMNIAIASPSGYSPARSIVERGMQFGDILITDSVAEAVKDADIVYTDVFISMSDEDDEKKKVKLEKYRVTKEVMALAKEDALFMHCMPVRRGEEVSADVADGPQSIMYDQAENRLHLNKAALALLMTGER